MSKAGRYSATEISRLVEQVQRDGFCVLPDHYDRELIAAWNKAFLPLLHDHIEREGALKNRGANRYYVTLPFEKMWADPTIYEDPDVLAVCEQLVGSDMVMCQLATDTPLNGSEYQEIHRDAPPLFPELKAETPAFQLAVNFPLVDVTLENGPFEVARGTHMMTKEEGFAQLKSGAAQIEPVLLKAGDVMIRDVRGLHRGTPNRTDEPRPMAVIGYSRRWLLRPEVQIQIPQAEFEKLSEKGKSLLRFNPVVESLDRVEKTEGYQNFAY
jgi:ectoine hydroxylase-related dioxygenase (phytanoyl-CoA dioxygenase family)